MLLKLGSAEIREIIIYTGVAAEVYRPSHLQVSPRRGHRWGTASTRPSLTMQLTSGVAVFVIVCRRRVDTLNKCSDNIAGQTDMPLYTLTKFSAVSAHRYEVTL